MNRIIVSNLANSFHILLTPVNCLPVLTLHVTYLFSRCHWLGWLGSEKLSHVQICLQLQCTTKYVLNVQRKFR